MNSKPETGETPVLIAKDYQKKLFEYAIQQDSIILLPTGSGKTYISTMVIKHILSQPESNNKTAAFIVENNVMVEQQYEYIKSHTDLKVGKYQTDVTKQKDEFSKFVKDNNVIVLLARTFVNGLTHGLMSLNDFAVVIIDECHHCHGQGHPYRLIVEDIKRHKRAGGNLRFMGLTSCGLNGKTSAKALDKEWGKLEKATDAKIIAFNEGLYEEHYQRSKECIFFANDYADKVKATDIESLETFNMLYNEPDKIKDQQLKEKIRKVLRCIIELFKQYGGYCAYLRAKAEYLPFLEEKKETAFLTEDETILVSTAYSAIQMFCMTYEKLRKQITTYETLAEYLAPQTVKIIEVLQGFYLNRMKNNQSFKAIIFVKQRDAAMSLCSLLQEVSLLSPELSFIRAGFVTGSEKSKTGDILQSSNAKADDVENFRSGLINVMVATNVLEEGVNIVDCNLVIFADIPQTFTSFVQSRGRARMSSSMFAIVVSYEDRAELLYNLIIIKKTEKLLLERMDNFSSYVPPSNQPVFHCDELEALYKTCTGASVSLSTALNILNRYISKLPSDPGTSLSAKFETFHKGSCVISKVLFPSNIEIAEISGDGRHTSAYLAEKSAALAACKVLHQSGELDDNLIPITSEKICENLGYNGLDTSDGIGTVQKRRLYSKEISDTLKGNFPVPGKAFHVYLIELDLVDTVSEEFNPKRRKVMSHLDTPHIFGLCLRKKIPKLPPFPIYEKYGQFMASFKQCSHDFTLQANELELIVKFNSYIFETILGLGDQKFDYKPDFAEFSSLVIPLKRGLQNHENFIIDFDVLRESVQGFPQSPNRETFVYFRQNYENAIIQPSYNEQGTEQPRIYRVCEVQTGILPSSPFPEENYKTFNSYYSKSWMESKKLEVKELIQEQELLDSERIPKSLNLIFPPHLKKKEKVRKEYLVPELVAVHPMPASVWLMSLKLPTILYRLNSLFNADDFRLKIANEAFRVEAKMPENLNWERIHYPINKDDTKSIGNNPFESSMDDISGEHDIVKSLSPEEVLPEMDSDTPLLISPKNYEQIAFDSETTDVKINAMPQTDEKLIEKCYENVGIGQIYNEKPISERLTASPLPLSMNSWFEVEKTEIDLFGVSPATLLQTFTTKGACDGFNLERLEFIGDSFLKVSVTNFVYHSHPKHHEGHLSFFRTSEVCNANLFNLGCKKNIPSLMIACQFEPKANWLPPGYVLNEDVKMESCDEVATNASELNDSEEYNAKLRQSISDKSVADCVEALIGAHLINLGADDTLKFMNWLGIKVLLKDVPVQSSANIPEDPEQLQLLKYAFQIYNTKQFVELEKQIGYTFRDKLLLLQAFTHVSYKNPIKGCYQRLEFLGDAILDYLITRYLYDYPTKFSPGLLTDLRSALVNNINFASLVVQNDLDKYLLHSNPSLQKSIEKFRDASKKNPSLNFNDSIDDEKVLGDIFESLAGAIYLDCGMDLKIVWQVFYNIMKGTIEECCRNPPLTPVRELMESYNDVQFIEFPQDGQACAKVIVNGNELPIVATGKSKRIAKKEAAFKALAHLKKNGGC